LIPVASFFWARDPPAVTRQNGSQPASHKAPRAPQCSVELEVSRQIAILKVRGSVCHCLSRGVRLPLGLGFTRARSSAIGDFRMACRLMRAPKSHGCNQLRPVPRIVFDLRISPLAPVFLSNLCIVLG
jgi:hypothetical protein